MKYAEALAYIASLTGEGWRLDLERIEEFLSRLGNPHLECGGVLHVTGTNGKGSVTAMIQSILTAAGYRTGGFFSPYVYDFRERVQYNCEMISKRDVARITEELKPVAQRMRRSACGRPTEFEFKTALGFVYWKRKRCEYVALEVGLGGRLDATNVVQPLVSVITEIGLDHQQFLGNSIDKIAWEKAGIIKPGRPIVCAVSHSAARKVIEVRARDLGCELWQYGKDFVSEDRVIYTPLRTIRGIRPGVVGSVQLKNAATAVAAIDIAGIETTKHEVKTGLRNTFLPGRMEIVCKRPLIVFDGAHNAQAASVTAKTLREEFCPKRMILVYSASGGHDAKQTLRSFRAQKIHAAPMYHARALSCDRLKRVLPPTAALHETVYEALQAAMSDAKLNDVILVSGSFYLLSEAKEAFFALTKKKAYGDLCQHHCR